MRYVWAATLVALGLLIGFILQPAFGRSQAYATFYPVVLIAAFALGPRPAVMVAGLSAAVAYWCFIPPAFQWKWDNQVGAALGFFLTTSTVAIWLINRLVHTAAGRVERSASGPDLARVNAVIFAELRAHKASSPITARPRAALASTARVSARSFGGAHLDRDAAELGQEKPQPSTARTVEATAAGDLGLTLH